MKRKKLICLLAAVLVCSLLLVGCSADDAVDGDDSAVTDETQTDDTATTTDDTQTDDTLSADMIGEVAYLGDNYFELTTYNVPEDAGDYTSLDLSTLTADGSSDYMYPDESTVYYLLSDGALVSAAAEDVEVGDLIVQTTTDDGEERIIILQKVESDA